MLIQLNQFSVNFQRKRIKNINLRIHRSGEVQLSAPLKMPLEFIHAFLEEKTPWIEKHRLRLQEIRKETKKRTEEQWIYFKGQRFELVLSEAPKEKIEIKNSTITINFKSGDRPDIIKYILNQWLKKEMQKLLPSLFAHWQALIGVEIAQVSVKEMKTRWGSCHPIKKKISLNLRLIEKPLNCLEYVIVHELVHLLEPSHNQRFYQLMHKFLPNWQETKSLLNRFGSSSF